MGIDPDRTFTVKEILGAVDRIFERPETTQEQRLALGQLVPELLGIRVPRTVSTDYRGMPDDETHSAAGERIRR